MVPAVSPKHSMEVRNRHQNVDTLCATDSIMAKAIGEIQLQVIVTVTVLTIEIRMVLHSSYTKLSTRTLRHVDVVDAEFAISVIFHAISWRPQE